MAYNGPGEMLRGTNMDLHELCSSYMRYAISFLGNTEWRGCGRIWVRALIILIKLLGIASRFRCHCL